ncbi:MAG: sulfate ABC transporter permease subunit CysT [Puniceicoccales bacterium]|jgi:sulfate transport system permease protein|nr:sulfate ABC transporter permease subunit CysT [Puniceicoccales bacterium]
MAFKLKQKSVLPGFNLSFGITIFYASLIVLIPLAAVFLRASGLSFSEFVAAAFSERVLASYKVTFLTAFAGAATNAFFGLILAWVLTRYRFPGHRVADALVDLPFALPTAVAGISLTAIYSKNGWVGEWLDKAFGLQVAYSELGIYVALTFIGLPFVVRTLQPVIEELEPEMEEAATTLGASRWQTLYKVVFPQLLPALLTGFSLAFSRALGEYGSVVFISGNMPMRTEITPLLIITKLHQYQYKEATAVAAVMLVASFILLLIINLLQRWAERRTK